MPPYNPDAMPVPPDGLTIEGVPSYLVNSVLTPVVNFWIGPVIVLLVFGMVIRRMFKP